jgi:hypothetical protein
MIPVPVIVGPTPTPTPASTTPAPITAIPAPSSAGTTTIPTTGPPVPRQGIDTGLGADSGHGPDKALVAVGAVLLALAAGIGGGALIARSRKRRS